MEPTISHPTARRVLGVFAKLPLPGHVKTRLAAETSPLWAAQVARAFLRDSLLRLARIPARHVLAYAPADSAAAFAEYLLEPFTLVPQASGDLGQRMAAFFAQQLAEGAEKVVLLGTDSPTLPLPLVEQAFAELDRADVVLGPATDGGYYLLGCARRVPPLFAGVRWSSSHVLADTLARLPADGRLALLPPWYDVDTLADWHMLRGHAAALLRAGTDPGVPHTLAVEEWERTFD